MKQIAPIVYNPATGWRVLEAMSAKDWRKQNGDCAFLFNPWTGLRRDARDVGTDPFGLLIVPVGEVLRVAKQYVKQRE